MSTKVNAYQKWRLCEICGKKWNYNHSEPRMSSFIYRSTQSNSWQYIDRVRHISDTKSGKFPYFKSCRTNECDYSYRDLLANLLHILEKLGVLIK